MVRAWGLPRRGPVNVSKVQGGRKEGPSPGLGPAPCVVMEMCSQSPPRPSPLLQPRGHEELQLRAAGQGRLQAPPGPLPSRVPRALPRQAVDRATLNSMFPKSRTETWYQKGHSGRELSMPRQMSQLDQGQGDIQLPPSASPHAHCSGGTGAVSAACGVGGRMGRGLWGLGTKRKSEWTEAGVLSAPATARRAQPPEKATGACSA